MAYKKDRIYIAIIIVLAAALVYYVSQNTSITAPQNPAVENVKNVYSLLTESPVTVLSVNEQSGLYRVLLRTTLRNGQNNVQEVFVTKDGSLITDRMINTTGYVNQLTKEKAFAECLVGKRVVVAGVSNDANTLLQLQLLGNFAYKVFVDCSGANQQLCQNVGITQVPTAIIGSVNRSATGVQPVSFFEQATGCNITG